MIDYIRDGQEIYRNSFAIIRAEANLEHIPADLEKLAVRVIHACGMVDAVEDLCFSPGAGKAGRDALAAGAPILCDARMVLEGVTRTRLPANNAVICTLKEDGVAEMAREAGNTRSAVALAEATAQRLRIVAPFDGVAGIRGVNVGDYLKDGADIVNVEDLDAVYVDFRLPERLQNKVKTGQTARVAFDALPGVQYSAVVLAINPQIDADGRSLAVRGCIDNRRLQLRPGMFARVTAVFGERSDANVVPEEAIVPDGAAPYVLRVVAGTEEGSQVAKRTPVRLGARTPGFVEVVEGLAPGDVVVTAGQQRLQRDGTAVRVVELGQPSAGRSAAGAEPPATASSAASQPVSGAATAAAPAAVPPLPGANPCQSPLSATTQPTPVRGGQSS